MTFDPNQMTLTCISTGGPATTVTWTRDATTVTEGTETVLNDPVTAQYTHTLTVIAAGVYTCTVANNKPSSDSASVTVPGDYLNRVYTKFFISWRARIICESLSPLLFCLVELIVFSNDYIKHATSTSAMGPLILLLC